MERPSDGHAPVRQGCQFTRPFKGVLIYAPLSTSPYNVLPEIRNVRPLRTRRICGTRLSLGSCTCVADVPLYLGALLSLVCLGCFGGLLR